MSDPNTASLASAIESLDPFGVPLQLSDDVLRHIFHLLDARALAQTALVCSHWHDVAWSHLRYLEFDNEPGVKAHTLKEFAKRCKELTALKLSRCLWVRDDCAPVLHQMRHLRSLHVYYCDWISDSFVSGLTEHPSLTELRLVASCRITLASPSLLPSRLSILTLSACRGLDADSIPQISRLSNLHSLDLSSVAPTLVKNDQIQFLAGLRQSLTFLNLSQAGIIDAVLAFVCELSLLKHLDLSKNAKITASGLSHLTNLQNIEFLDLSRCPLVTNLALFPLSHLVTLRYLDLSFTGITDDSLETISTLGALTHFAATTQTPGPAFLSSLARSNAIQSLRLLDSIFDPTDLYLFKSFSMLRSVDLSGASGIGDFVFLHLAQLHQLHTVSICQNTELTHNGVAQLKPLPILSSLILHWCGRISDHISAALADFPALTYLSLRSCKAITDAVVPPLLQIRKLQTLDITFCSEIKNAKLHASEAASKKINLLYA